MNEQASPSFIAAIARALAVSIIDLTEQPYGIRDAHPTSEQARVPALRQAMAEGDHPELDTSLRSLDDLRAALADITAARCKDRYAEVVRSLPDLLRHLHGTVNTCPADARHDAHELLSAAYYHASAALRVLGHLDLSHLADERARAAAARGDDPLRAAVAEWNHSQIQMLDGAYPAALHSIDRAAALVSLTPPTPAVPAVKGALHLRAALIAARATNSDLAAEHMVIARSLAIDGQDEANFYDTKFGPSNVAIHEVAIPVELADGTTAVTQAAQVRLHPTPHPPGSAATGSISPRPGCCMATGGGHWTRCSMPGGSLPAHPLSPTSARHSARPRSPGRPIHSQPTEFRCLVRHPDLTTKDLQLSDGPGGGREAVSLSEARGPPLVIR